MAVKKQVTFEGLKYNLDNDKRVTAAAAVNSVPLVVTHQIHPSASIGGGANSLGSGSIFVADRSYTIEGINFQITATGSAATVIRFEVADNGTQLGGGTKVFARSAGDTSASLSLYTGAKNHSVTGSLTGTPLLNTSMTSGQALNLLCQNSDNKGAIGVISVALRTDPGSAF